jgi:uncharacterized protein
MDNNDAKTVAEAFCRAAFEGDVPTLRRLLAAGADIDQVGWLGRTPLIDAVNGGNIDAIRFLLDAGADANVADTGGTTPLLQAIDVVCDGAHQDDPNGRPEPSTEIVTLLLQYGADPRRPSTNGQTPVEAARSWGARQLASVLLNAGG